MVCVFCTRDDLNSYLCGNLLQEWNQPIAGTIAAVERIAVVKIAARIFFTVVSSIFIIVGSCLSIAPCAFQPRLFGCGRLFPSMIEWYHACLKRSLKFLNFGLNLLTLISSGISVG